MGQHQILVVEDNSLVAKDIQKRLRSLGYDVPLVVSTGEKAIHAARETKPDLVLMDIMLKGAMDGLEAAAHISAQFDVPVVYLTAYADDTTLQRAKATGPFGYLLKPFNETELHTTIEIALYKHRMEKKLRESQQWLATTLRSIGDAVIATDTNGSVLFINPAAESLTGWGMDEARGKALAEVFRKFNDTTLIARDGRHCPIEATMAPIRDADGVAHGVVLAFRDITGRLASEKAQQEAGREIRRLNVELQQKLTELIAVNKELATFNYSVSHDLRTPLINVDGFARVLLDEHGNTVTGEVRDYLQRIGTNTRAMLHLIDDLLSYTRLSRSELDREELSMTALVQGVVDELKAMLPRRTIIFKLGTLPPAYGDRALIRQVLMNLLSNAVKFSEHKDPAVIETGSVTLDERTVYFVKDNGVGFDMKHAARLFEMFHRLHSATRFEGSGLGLAIVHRIVKRHGGDAWAEGKTNRGATFSFTLPHPDQSSV